MKYFKIVSMCLVALALPVLAGEEVYETRDAEGDVEFTDSPPTENAEVIELQQTNIVPAPSPDSQSNPQDQSQPAAAQQQQTVQQNNTVIESDGYDDGDYDDGEYVDGVDQRELRRDEAVNRADPNAPDEVGDSESQMPREVGDSESQMPHEVGDSEAQMPHEVGDFRAKTTGGHAR